jgi:hypothetical protein
MSGFIEQKIAPEFSAYGLELTKLLIENISLPPKVEEALDKRTGMGLTGNLDDYLKYQAAESLGSGGSGSSAAGDAMGMGMGFAMASQMANSMGNTSAHNQASPPPPPIPKAQTYHFAIDGASKGPMTIEQIKTAIHQGEITQETLAWREGMSQWQRADEVDGLSELFKSTPPPIPS